MTAAPSEHRCDRDGDRESGQRCAGGDGGRHLDYTENDAATAIDAALTTSDVDNTTLEGATVQITDHYAGEDVSASRQTAITGAITDRHADAERD